MRAIALCFFLATLLLSAPAAAQQPDLPLLPTTLEDFFLPGSQPGESANIEGPNRCGNCHGGYDRAVEPHWNWMGSMMAQAARDPLFYACMAIANQDAADSGDLCIRCHTPTGWLEGRSVPTDGSALNDTDREGIQCDFCHKLVKPWPLGSSPYPDDPDYMAETYAADQSYLPTITQIPPHSGNGMYVADSASNKRGPFVDAAARHQMYYSPFHQDANLCGTCHDVSNPAFERQPDNTYLPNALDTRAPDFDKYTMFPVERTFSEWLNSEYALPGGVFAPQFGGNKLNVSTCQDCHMPDVTGQGCNKKGAPVRDDLPHHDMTGGNTFIPNLVPIAFPGETDEAALQDGILRARAMLQKAATLDLDVNPGGSGYVADVRVWNETGHKLPSGYPEGRRLWLNVQAIDVDGNVIYESCAYDLDTGVLTKDADAKIYEIKLGMSPEVAGAVGLTPGESFHFVLNNYVVKDNRIPPRGFTNAAFEAIQSPPVDYSYADGEYWDDTVYDLPAATAQVTVTLYYQTVSKDYVDFLRDENVTNDWGQRFHDMWATNGKSAPEVMATQTVTLQQIVDNEAPTVPLNLSATATSWRNVDLIWDASTDNVGVAGYDVLRDGVVIAQATTNSYSDGSVAAETTYSYTVRAYDAVGNVSVESVVSQATTPKRKGGGKTQGKLPLGSTVMFASDLNPVPAGGTGISFYLPKGDHVQLRVVDVSGRLTAELSSRDWPAGHHSVFWNAEGVASGVYMLVMETSEGQLAQKVTLLR